MARRGTRTQSGHRECRLTCFVVHLGEVLVDERAADGGEEAAPVVPHGEVGASGFNAEEDSCNGTELVDKSCLNREYLKSDWELTKKT